MQEKSVEIMDFRFFTDLHVLECIEYDYTIFTWRFSVYLCVTHFLAALAQKLVDEIA